MEDTVRGKGRKRHRGDDPRDDQYSKRRHLNGKPMLTILVPNFVVGKLIGKGGTNINELENQFSAIISISPSKKTYPGTEDRIINISAATNQIIDLNNYIIEHVQTDRDDITGNILRDGFRKHLVKIVVTEISVGLVIGKGGSTINAIENDSKAKINISKRDESLVRGERIITIAGSVEQRIKASCRIIEKIAGEPNNVTNGSLEYTSSGFDSVSMALTHSPHLSYESFQPDITSYIYGSIPTNLYDGLTSITHTAPAVYQPKSRVKVTFQVEMIIPNAIVGAIMGKNGLTVNEISKVSGAKIIFSGKNEFVPGTTDRILTIKGGLNQIQNAYFLIDEKVAQVENEMLLGAYR